MSGRRRYPRLGHRLEAWPRVALNDDECSQIFQSFPDLPWRGRYRLQRKIEGLLTWAKIARNSSQKPRRSEMHEHFKSPELALGNAMKLLMAAKSADDAAVLYCLPHPDVPTAIDAALSYEFEVMSAEAALAADQEAERRSDRHRVMPETEQKYPPKDFVVPDHPDPIGKSYNGSEQAEDAIKAVARLRFAAARVRDAHQSQNPHKRGGARRVPDETREIVFNGLFDTQAEMARRYPNVVRPPKAYMSGGILKGTCGAFIRASLAPVNRLMPSLRWSITDHSIVEAYCHWSGDQTN